MRFVTIWGKLFPFLNYLLKLESPRYSPSFFHRTTGWGCPLGGEHFSSISSPRATSVSRGLSRNSSRRSGNKMYIFYLLNVIQSHKAMFAGAGKKRKSHFPVQMFVLQLSYLSYSCPTDPFTNLEPQNPTQDVPDLNKIRRLANFVALKF